MLEKVASSAYVAAELRARQLRDNHDFDAAAQSAKEAALIAGEDGDPVASWAMKFFQAENLMEAGDFDGCAKLALELLADPQGAPAVQASARANILLSKAWQGAGLLEDAAEAARAAVELSADEADIDVNVKARQALIAALADRGNLDEAWAECRVLASVISDDVDEQLAGKAFWVIGNVAFLSDRVEEGLKYHELAASTFSPAKNLDVWAKFNKASAAMRLAAEVADADTLRCIERAELATDVIGGSSNDHLLLKLNRAHWSYLAGDPAAAIELLEDLPGLEDHLSPQRSAEACLLLGRSQLALGNKPEARRWIVQASNRFDSSGASHRAQQARDLLRTELGREPIWHWMLRTMGLRRD